MKSIQSEVVEALPGGERQLASYRLRVHLQEIGRARAATLLLPIYLLLAAVPLAAVSAVLAARGGEADGQDDASGSMGVDGMGLDDGGIVSSFERVGAPLVAAAASILPAAKAGWGAFQRFRADLVELAEQGAQAAAESPDFGDRIEDMGKVKEELDLLGDVMTGSHLRLLLYVDDLDRLGTKDAKAVDVMDHVFMLLGTETRVPVICILAVWTARSSPAPSRTSTTVKMRACGRSSTSARSCSSAWACRSPTR